MTVTVNLPKLYPEHTLDQRLYWEHILDAAYAAATEDEAEMHTMLYMAERCGPVPDFLPGLMVSAMGKIYSEDEMEILNGLLEEEQARTAYYLNKSVELTAELKKLKGETE